MITHLRNRGGALDLADTKTLLAERDQEWEANEVPTHLSSELRKGVTAINEIKN